VSRGITTGTAYRMVEDIPREDDRDEELDESPTPDPEEKDPTRPDEDPEAD
jgi:hypothetical protein